MLQPKRTKYRKRHKGRNRGLASGGGRVSFGEYGLQALSRAQITARQIEAARRAVTRHVRRGAKIWIRIFPDHPITRKALGERMGRGKGKVEFWVANVKPGTMLYEIEGVPETLAQEALRRAAMKLPVRTGFIHRTLA